MNSRGAVIAAALALWCSAACQQALATRLSIWGFRPDFLLLATSLFCFFVPRRSAIYVGFFAGLVHGALTGIHMAAYVISRSLVGFFGSVSRHLGVEPTLLVVGITTLILTLLAQTVWMFLAGPKGVASFLGDTIRSAVYNGLLSMPLYALLRRFLKPLAHTGF
jgi:rod shape-determining protein MreD